MASNQKRKTKLIILIVQNTKFANGIMTIGTLFTGWFLKIKLRWRNNVLSLLRLYTKAASTPNK